MNLARIVEGHPRDAVAVVAGGGALTYGGLRDLVDARRAGLAALGLGPGDRVGLVAGNDVVAVTTGLAVLGAGLVLVPLDRSSPARELEHQLAHVGARGWGPRRPTPPPAP